MAGLAGIVAFDEDAGAPASELVERMCAVQAHRGPDDRVVVRLGNLTLGVVRLRARHLPVAPCQSSRDERADLYVGLDGEIFNHDELKRELIAKGQVFQANTDTELVRRAYEAWGDQCFARLHGPFALAVCDRKHGRTMLVRDHYGVKPLHYTVRARRLLFASEIKPLLDACPDYRLNQRALLEWSLYGDVLPPETLFEGFLSVPPGHVLEISAPVFSPVCRRYYRAADHVDPDLYSNLSKQSVAEILDLLDGAIQDSMTQCLAGNVGVGVMLSGGVDSALITALARRQKPITAFHLSVPDDPRLDERPMAERVAKQFGVPLVTYSMSGDAFLRELTRATHLNEMPLWHMQCVAFYLTVLQARERDVQVLLSGDSIGALLGAETGRHRAERWLTPLRSNLARLPTEWHALLHKGISASRGMPVTIPGFLPSLAHVMSLLDGYARADLNAESQQAYRFVADPVDRAIHATKLADLRQWLHRFHHRGDRLAMAAAIDYRNPFQDPRSVHLAINLPLAFNIRKRTAKWGLKEVATRYLPRDIAFQKKVAWDLPAALYLAPLARLDFFEDGFCSEAFQLSGPVLERIVANWRTDLPTFFKLVHVEIWGRLFILRQPIEDVMALVTRSAAA